MNPLSPQEDNCAQDPGKVEKADSVKLNKTFDEIFGKGWDAEKLKLIQLIKMIALMGKNVKKCKKMAQNS
uniref:Uncharacterized protein n=1 Tax=Globodera rostochiensis TaxID=31243 RepID=A0A914GPP7_GLORO